MGPIHYSIVRPISWCAHFLFTGSSCACSIFATCLLAVKNIVQYIRTLSYAFNGSSGPNNISLTTPMFEPNLSLDHPVFVFFYHSSTIVHKYCRLLWSLNFLHHVQYSSAYHLLLPDHLVDQTIFLSTFTVFASSSSQSSLLLYILHPYDL
jgi:hypothetical protein